ncbi:MAG: NUDIX domain-containing protein [Brumimicrobium sp.]
MYKVFIDNIPIFFQKETRNRTNLPSEFYPVLEIERYDEFVKYLNHNAKKVGLFVQSTEPILSLQLFFSKFKYIEAAGGVVYNSKKDSYLFIKRHGYWDIPKGKIEKGESLEEAALREVNEECGINDLTIQKLICTTYHTYFAYGKYHLKKTYWYYMLSDDFKKLSPQFEEGITETKWIPKESWDTVKENTFKSIEEVLLMLSLSS